ncbi:capsid cement protein [Anaerovibrio sp. RM50]|uniref:capsid cement protein n=1 Tax=Anaerovibrio sp. RM50 TaxID=1200557 RepID=UPI000684C188|nr:capsid cement protein [Anaerovibrio sp. RM50]
MFNGSIINTSSTIVEVAGAKIENGPFTAVAFSEGGFVACDDKSIPVGIMVAETDDVVEAGDDVTAVVKDIALWTAGGEIAKGDALACDANGCAVKATTGKFILGFALSSADSAGQAVRVQITKSGYEK